MAGTPLDPQALLEKLAADVRKHKPGLVSFDFSRRLIEMPSENGWRNIVDGGWEHVSIEIDW